MLSPEDIKIQKHFLLGVLIIVLVLLGINYKTGYFTRMHLSNEESMAIEHGADSSLYQQMVSELMSDLKSDMAWKRQLAAVELGHLGKGAAKAEPVLEQLLQDPDKEVRSEAALALARMGHYSTNMVGPLMKLLQGKSEHEKYWAAKALGLIGPSAREALPLLRQELQADPPQLRKVLQEALQRIGGGS